MKGDIELKTLRKSDLINFDKEEKDLVETSLKFQGIIDGKTVKLEIKLETNHVEALMQQLNLYKKHSNCTLVLKPTEQQTIERVTTDQKPLAEIMDKDEAKGIIERNKIEGREAEEEKDQAEAENLDSISDPITDETPEAQSPDILLMPPDKREKIQDSYAKPPETPEDLLNEANEFLEEIVNDSHEDHIKDLEHEKALVDKNLEFLESKVEVEPEEKPKKEKPKGKKKK